MSERRWGRGAKVAVGPSGLDPDKSCPLCFGSGTQHCGLAAHEDGRGCGEPCACPYRVPTAASANFFLQWKGTNACFDMTCGCGQESHFDGYFANAVKCPGCGALFEMPANLTLGSVASTSHKPVVPERDQDANGGTGV